MSIIRLPGNGWRPRPYQVRAWQHMFTGGARTLLVWHRRGGKDEVALHHEAESSQRKTATYWHMLPEYAQGRKAIWEAVNPHTGMRRIDEAFPESIREHTSQQSMTIEMKNGSMWHVVGSDNYDKLVGTPPYGIVFSEWALADPAAWAYLRPILDENGGWAVFIYTSRGRNHGYSLYQMAKNNPNWYCELLTADDTGVFTPQQLDAAQSELNGIYGPEVGEAVFQQEYYCSFTAAVLGAFYGKLMEQAENGGRIGDVPYNPSLPVTTSWDIGPINTAIWFVQRDGPWHNVIDYYDPSVDDFDFVEQGLPRFAKVLQRKGYLYGRHVAGWDISHGDFGNGMLRAESAKKLGIEFVAAPYCSVNDGVHAVKSVLPLCRFDAVKCRRGLEALSNYRTKYDEAKRTFLTTPVKDWSTHPADAFRYHALSPEHAPPPPPPAERYQRQHSEGWMT